MYSSGSMRSPSSVLSARQVLLGELLHRLDGECAGPERRLAYGQIEDLARRSWRSPSWSSSSSSACDTTNRVSTSGV